MLIRDNNRVLVLAPHTDDGELGCGGTIHRMIRKGAEVWYVAFSTCAESLPEGFKEDTLIHELYAATKQLGIKKENVIINEYKVRHLSEHRQEILEKLVQLNKEIDPDIVFIPSINDVHQDHHTISEESLRAFKKKTIFTYEMPWNNYQFYNQAFFNLQKEDVNAKIQALEKYESQKKHQYMQKENIIAVLRMHGIQAGVDYAEVFEVPRLML